jgi:G:T/U-mismatch repair DNA glycosylase
LNPAPNACQRNVGGNSCRPKTYQENTMSKEYLPFEDITETHPWVRFPQYDNASLNLIIGSFPPNKFTSHKEKLTMSDMNFFYGSKENSFWELFTKAKKLNFKLPDELDDLKNWLKENNWMVTDIVKSTKRKKDTAYDTDMLQIEWNLEAINNIIDKNPIEKIFFTSQWVKNNFDKKIRPKLNSKEIINEIILLSPSRNGLRTAKKAKFTNQAPLPVETSEEFRKRYYETVFN